MNTARMNGMVALQLDWDAYTRPEFDDIYDAHADRIGYRPQFSVRHGGTHAVVITTDADFPHVCAIVEELNA